VRVPLQSVPSVHRAAAWLLLTCGSSEFKGEMGSARGADVALSRRPATHRHPESLLAPLLYSHQLWSGVVRSAKLARDVHPYGGLGSCGRCGKGGVYILLTYSAPTVSCHQQHRLTRMSTSAMSTQCRICYQRGLHILSQRGPPNEWSLHSPWTRTYNCANAGRWMTSSRCPAIQTYKVRVEGC
jgi:hypothetical protein